jgi:hypothetical protein
MSLVILMADDHKKQIEDARDTLRKLGHDIRDAFHIKSVCRQPFLALSCFTSTP